MARSKIKTLLTEKFFPYLFLFFILAIVLIAMNRKIRNRNALVSVNLNQEEDSRYFSEQLIINQKIDTEKFNANDSSILMEINDSIDHQQWQSGVKKIKGLENSQFLNNTEIKLTLAYLYYETGEYDKGIDLFNVASSENNPRYFFNLGLLQSRQVQSRQQAITNFKKYLKTNDNSYEALVNIGHLYFQTGNYNEALDYFTKSTRITDVKEKAKSYFLISLTQEKINKDNDAVKSLDMAVQLDPEMTSARVRRSKILLKMEPGQAISELTEITQTFPEYPDTYNVLVEYYLEHNESDSALKWMQAGLQKSSNSIQLKSAAGNLYLKMKEYEKAKRIYEELVELFPQETSYQFNLGRSCLGLNDYITAADIFNKVLQIRPDYYEAFIHLGSTYSMLNIPDKAVSYYKKAIDVDPGNPVAYFEMGVLYGKSENKSAALDAYAKAIGIKKDYPEVYYNMAELYNKIADLKNAETNYLSAIHYDKKYVDAYLNLAGIYESQGQLGKAKDLLQKGLEYTVDFELKNKLAHVYELSKENKKAMDLYSEILDSESDNTAALISISRLYRNLRNYRQSRNFIEKYIQLNPREPEARYILMVDEYNTGAFNDAYKQWEILDRIAPNYQDIGIYKDKIFSRLN